MAAGDPGSGNGRKEGKGEDFYTVLGVSRSASLEEVREAYFERALLSHPDLAEPGDERSAAEAFRRLAQAFWVLTDPVRRDEYDHRGWADMGGFSPDAAHEALLVDGVFGGSAVLDDIVGAELQMQGPEECFQRFSEAVVEPTGPIVGERWRCELCGFQVRGRERVLAHVAKVHGAESVAWAGRGLAHAKGSFLSFLKASASLGTEAFPLADGTRVRFSGSQPSPRLLQSSCQELERALQFDDPCGAAAVEGALTALSPEAQEVILNLHEVSRGIGAYLAPLEGSDPNLAAPHQPELLGK